MRTIEPDSPPAFATILWAEDDAELREFVTESLKKEGYRVMQFCDGAELGQWLATHPSTDDTTVLLTDIFMPGATAFDLFERYPVEMADFTVILFTGFGTESLHDRAMALGAFAVIDKPFDMKQLKDTITHVLSARTAAQIL
ncbi:MAG: response regulator [Deltaproteobacteria bacterium]|nr:response regulator [Deltaproteobacteria bacterium]